MDRALDALEGALGEGMRGVVLRRVGGGHTLAADPVAEDAARHLLSKPRTPPLTQAQAETLAIVSYLQPVSRPEIARIRGVSSESAVATLTERGLIEESGRSRFGAVVYRTTPLFERLFGLAGLDQLPDPPASTRRPRTSASCASGCCGRASSGRGASRLANLGVALAAVAASRDGRERRGRPMERAATKRGLVGEDVVGAERAIAAVQIGDPAGSRVTLVVGVIHGDRGQPSSRLSSERWSSRRRRHASALAGARNSGRWRRRVPGRAELARARTRMGWT